MTTGNFIIGGGVGVVCTGTKLEWQVVAAGSIQTGRAIMVRDEDISVDDICYGPYRAPPGYAYVLCTHNIPPLLSASASQQPRLSISSSIDIADSGFVA